MTQKDILLQVLGSFPDQTGTNTELIDSLGFKPASVRRLTGTLTKKGLLERIERGTYRLIGMFRHFISAGFYCSGKRKIYFAKTFKSDDKDIFYELVDELTNYTIDMCSEAKNDSGDQAESRQDYNYEVELIEIDDVNQSFIYPEIEVGLES